MGLAFNPFLQEKRRSKKSMNIFSGILPDMEGKLPLEWVNGKVLKRI